MTSFSSVYRLQLNEKFPLKKATLLLPYLKELGVEGVYCSPFYEACSPHGYDITNPNKLNPTLGTPADFDAFCDTLKKLNLSLVVDVVPNHMGVKEGKNAWWQDVLKNGPSSPYAHFFDIDFSPEKEELENKVLLPILGDTYGAVLQRGEIELKKEDHAFYITYGAYKLPVSEASLSLILKHFSPGKKEEEVLALFNGTIKEPMHELLEKQFYRLAYWKVASHEINYRRFFNIHELAAIRIEEEEVFKAHHKWLFELIDAGKVQGLRIDHPDGLYDPEGYFHKIKEHFNGPVVVEKILDRQEKLPATWAVEGTVGYEYLNVLNGVFIRQDQEPFFTTFYEQFIGEKLDFEELLYQKKKLFTEVEMVSEMGALGLLLDRLSENSRYFRDFTRLDLTLALQEVIACFPVYRTYVSPEGRVSASDAKIINVALARARRQATHLDPSIFAFIEKVLLLQLKDSVDEELGYLDFVLKFQQLTGPIMAKGLEDTTFYIFNRFIALNEVGGDPPHFGRSVADFHCFNHEKQAKWPLGFLPTSTHDTKRSEDVRMRLDVLSELASLWQDEVTKWASINEPHKTQQLPHKNTEYFIYQTLVGVWPQQGSSSALFDRLWPVILKSIREAREYTSWITPNKNYEAATKRFLHGLLSDEKNNPFLKRFIPFQKKIDKWGGYNTLAMTALKLASCGVVDIYQGNEILDYSLVDPDNRREVDFKRRQTVLAAVKNLSASDIKALLQAGEISILKGFLYKTALQFRQENQALFLQGEYFPLEVQGQNQHHLIAFYRKLGGEVLVVTVGRFFASLNLNPLGLPLGEEAWGDTKVVLPGDWAAKEVENVFTHEKHTIEKQTGESSLKIAQVFTTLPLAYLRFKHA